MTFAGKTMNVWEPTPQMMGRQFAEPTRFSSDQFDTQEEAIAKAVRVTSFSDPRALVEPEGFFSRVVSYRFTVGEKTYQFAKHPVATPIVLGSVAFWPKFESPLRPIVPPSQERVLGLIDKVCKSLHLGVRVAARLVDLSVRRYHEVRGNEKMPLPKLLAAADVAEALDRFYGSEPDLVAAFFKDHEEEAVRLLVSGHYDEFASHLGELQVARDRELAALPIPTEPIEMPSGAALTQMLKVLRNPAFDDVLKILATRSRATTIADEVWWLKARADLAAAYAQIADFDPVDDAFEFLLTMDDEGAAAFGRRANETIDLATSQADWETFLAQESKAAFATYAPYVAELEAARSSNAGAGLISEDEIGFFESIGMDLATGQMIDKGR